MKKKLEIDPLKPIKDILEKDLGFLSYTTFKRNLAYQLQFLQFLKSLSDNYTLYGGLKNIFCRYELICITNSYEYILRAILHEKKPIRDRKKIPFTNLTSAAKKNNLITKKLEKKLNSIYNIRNKIHPEKQKDLDVNTFTESLLNDAFSALENLQNELQKKPAPVLVPVRAKRPQRQDECDYCILFQGEVCPGCGNISI